MHPDFVIFNEVGGEIAASIVDPHGHHLDDALVKLQALANFAATFGESFHRIEAVAEVQGNMRVLDVQRAEVREAVLLGRESAAELYKSVIGADYDPGGSTRAA